LHDWSANVEQTLKRFGDIYRKSIREGRALPRAPSSLFTPESEFLCIGVGSRQWSGKHICFLDLDGYSKKESEIVAKKLISSKGLSDCYIIQSSPGNHHLVCFDMMPFSEVLDIAETFGHQAWAKFRGRDKDFVLRISPKMKLEKGKFKPVKDTYPELVSVIRSPFSYRAKSNGLRRIFRNVWGYPIDKDDKFTDSRKVRFHLYRVRLVGKSKDVIHNDN
jgi:hypothetical protein